VSGVSGETLAPYGVPPIVVVGYARGSPKGAVVVTWPMLMSSPARTSGIVQMLSISAKAVPKARRMLSRPGSGFSGRKWMRYIWSCTVMPPGGSCGGS